MQGEDLRAAPRVDRVAEPAEVGAHHGGERVAGAERRDGDDVVPVAARRTHQQRPRRDERGGLQRARTSARRYPNPGLFSCGLDR